MEELGCVFLPAAFYRNGATMAGLDQGRYWASGVVYTVGEYRGGTLEFTSLATVSTASSNCQIRDLGQSVRLIRDAE